MNICEEKLSGKTGRGIPRKAYMGEGMMMGAWLFVAISPLQKEEEN